MVKAAADRAAVADLIMRDMSNSLPQQRVGDLQPPIALDVAPAHPGAEADATVADSDAVEAGNAPQIDQLAGRRQPKGEQRHQALPAGDHRRLRIRREQVDRFPNVSGDWYSKGAGFIPRLACRANTAGSGGAIRSRWLSVSPHDGGTRVASSQPVPFSSPAAVSSPCANVRCVAIMPKQILSLSPSPDPGGDRM